MTPLLLAVAAALLAGLAVPARPRHRSARLAVPPARPGPGPAGGGAAPAGKTGSPGWPSAAWRALPELVALPWRASRRRRALEEAVPEVLDVLRATIAAGTTPRRGLQAAAEGAPAPLWSLLGEALRAAELGSGAGRALAAAARTERLTELMVAGEALDLAETTGAPPGPVLAGVAAAAADRVRARQARMAATAQARLSARVVAGMAPAFLGVLAATSPADAAFLVREPLGWAALAAAAAFEAMGCWWAARIVRGTGP
jgi:tight adherence protein B